MLGKWVTKSVLKWPKFLTRAHDRVYTLNMKNITFSAKEEAIEKARKAAARQHRTLNELFREWLENVNKEALHETASNNLNSLWEQTGYLRVGKKLSRDEMNKR